MEPVQLHSKELQAAREAAGSISMGDPRREKAFLSVGIVGIGEGNGT